MEEETIKNELQKYNVTDAAIARLRTEYMAMTVNGVDDKVGYEAVKTARIDIKKRRVEVEKTRVTLKAESLEYGRRVDGEAKRITALLEPIETYLTGQEKIVEDEKARIKAEVEAKEAERLQERIKALIDLGCNFDGQNYFYGDLKAPIPLIKVASDEQFVEMYGRINTAAMADLQKKAEEVAALKAEAERIAKVQADQEAERQRLTEIARKQEATQAAIEAEKQRIADAEKARLKAIEDEKTRIANEKRRAEELEQAKKEAAEQALKDAEARRLREEADRIERERKEKEASEKKAARRPDKTKLTEWLNNFSIPEMDMKTTEGKKVWAEMVEIMKTAVANMRREAEAL